MERLLFSWKENLDIYLATYRYLKALEHDLKQA